MTLEMASSSPVYWAVISVCWWPIVSGRRQGFSLSCVVMVVCVCVVWIRPSMCAHHSSLRNASFMFSAFDIPRNMVFHAVYIHLVAHK